LGKADYDYWILEILDSEGSAWTRELLKRIRRHTRFRNAWIEERLYDLMKKGYLLEEKKQKETKKPGRPRTYYTITDKGKMLLFEKKHTLEREEEIKNTLERHWREGSELEWARLYDGLKEPFRKQLQTCFNRVTEIEGLRTRSFRDKIIFNTKRYRGSITIEWSLAPEEMERRNRLLDAAIRREDKPMPILKEGKPLEDGSASLIEIGYRTPDGKVVLFEEQPKELVDSLKARKIVIDKDAKPQEAPIPKPSAGFSKRMKEKKEKLRKALFGYMRDKKGEIERSR